MLNKLLNLLNSGEGFTQLQIAQKLGVSPSLVASMLEQLARSGYLEENGPGCGSSCSSDGTSGCGTQGSCLIGFSNKTWSLSAKGLSWSTRQA
jgi:hypothetical protein